VSGRGEDLQMAAAATPESNHDHRRGRSYQVLRHRDYRLLFSGQIVSVAGSQIQSAAIAWQLFELTGDPVKLGLLGLCRFVPLMIFGIAGGVVADRGDRRRILLVTQLVLLMTSGMLALLTWADSINALAIYSLVIVAATVEAVSNPTRQALIPLLVPRAEIPAASTMSLIGFHLATVGGPAAGGLIIAWQGVAAAYLVDALSFLAVIAAVLLMHARPAIPAITIGSFAAALEGLRFLRKTPVLLGVMTTDFFATFFGVSTSLMPIFAVRVLDVGPRGLGLLLSAPAVGAVASAVFLGVVRLPNRAGLTVLVSIGLYGACLLGFGLSTSFSMSLLFLAGTGASDSVSMTLRHAIRSLLTPDELRGRVAAVQGTLGAGGPRLGEFEAGLLAAWSGAGPAVAIGGVLTVITAIVVARVVPQIPRFLLSSVISQVDAVPTEAANAKTATAD
jgi:MFS family permease